MTAAWLGMAFGVLSWCATAFIASPLSQALALRNEVAEKLAKHSRFFDPLPFYDQEPPCVEAKEALGSCGARLVAFYDAHRPLHWLFLIAKFDVQGAGRSLLAVSAANWGFALDQAVPEIRRALLLPE